MSPADCKALQATSGWPGKEKTAAGLVTHWPSPQMLHPISGTGGQPPAAITGAGVGAIGAGVGITISSHAQTPIKPGKKGQDAIGIEPASPAF